MKQSSSSESSSEASPTLKETSMHTPPEPSLASTVKNRNKYIENLAKHEKRQNSRFLLPGRLDSLECSSRSSFDQ